MEAKPGQYTLYFNNKPVYFYNLNDLSNKLRIPIHEAYNLTKNNKIILYREPGEDTILFRGFPINFRDISDLARKLGMNKIEAQQVIDNIDINNGRKIVIDSSGNTELINIQNNFDGLLLRRFGIKKLQNRAIADNVYIPDAKVAILNKLSPNSKAKYIITIVYYINFGSDPVTRSEVLNKNGKLDNELLEQYIRNKKIVVRTEYFVFDGYNDEIKNFIIRKTNEYVKTLRFANFIGTKYKIGSYYSNKKLYYKKGYVREFDNTFELTEWANIEYNRSTSNDTCAVQFISNRYPKLHWDIKRIETNNGVMLDDFLSFCKDNDIYYKIYDERGILKYKCKEDTKLYVNCIIYNNHIYPINGGKPKKIKYKEIKNKLIDNSKTKLQYFLEEKSLLPSKIVISPMSSFNNKKKIDDVHITSFTVRDTKYICNGEYNICLDILTKMGYSEYIYDNINITDIPYLLEKILRTSECYSFIPENDIFKTSPLLYKNISLIKQRRQIKTIDKNKCYAYCLYNLPYLIKFDYRKDKVNVNPLKITNEYLYIVSPHKWSILMPCTKLYSGSFVKKCKKVGLQFTILEELETEVVPNHYREIIKLMYNSMTQDDFKTVMNIFIGKMERSMAKKYTYNYVGIYNEESSDMYEGFRYKLGKNNLIFRENEKYNYCRNKLPIATQIKDESRMLIYNKIIELGLCDNDIIQINTDSISYYGKDPKILNKKFDSWKQQDFKEIGDISECCDEQISLINLENLNENPRILHAKYAGCGKTTYIILDLIDRLTKVGISYIVLCPTHKSLSIFKKYKINSKRFDINSDIIQRYIFDKTIPKETYVIIDEIGFLDRACHDFLYYLSKAGKSYECFGDFNQLLPIKENSPLNQQYYINYLFNEIRTEFTNYRNNFTKEYYDDIINEKVVLIDEINKWSTKNFEDAEYILCYTHKTKQIYNEKMLEKKGFNTWLDDGVRIICTTNKLIKTHDIFNHQEFTISSSYKKKNSTRYFIKDEDNQIYKITDMEIKNFSCGYALNIHQAQGSTFESYYWADKDNKFINGRLAYTIISRLKQKLI